MIAVFGAVIAVTVFVLWQGFFRTQGPAQLPGPSLPAGAQKVELKFDVLESAAFQTLGQPPVSAPSSSKVGRANPFLPFNQKPPTYRR